MKKILCTGGVIRALALPFVLTVSGAAAETFEPRYPVPAHVSQEAQAVLARPVEINRTVAPSTDEEWRAQRRILEARFRPRLNAQLSSLPVSIARGELAGIPIYEITPKAPIEPKQGKVLMNVHGGAYYLMGGEFSVLEGLGLAAKGHYRVVSVDYRMPPEHPFPAAVDDGVAVYRELLKTYEPKDIAIFGSSAGGGLAAAVTLAIRDAGMAMPGAVVMHTPWADLSKTGDSYFTNDGVDPNLTTYDGHLEAAAKLYAGEAGLKHPLVSPVYADYSKGFPPALLSTGTRDLLLSCTVRLHRQLRRSGVPADLHVFDAMWHGLSMMPEGQELQAETLAFLQEHLGKYTQCIQSN